MSLFIKLWAEDSSNIVEKIELKLIFDGKTPYLRGNYFNYKASPVVQNLDREFKTKEEAVAHLLRSNDEFLSKYVEAKGFRKLSDDDEIEIIGTRLDKDWGIKNL